MHHKLAPEVAAAFALGFKAGVADMNHPKKKLPGGIPTPPDDAEPPSTSGSALAGIGALGGVTDDVLFQRKGIDATKSKGWSELPLLTDLSISSTITMIDGYVMLTFDHSYPVPVL